MSWVANQTDDVKKFSVCYWFFTFCRSDINSPVGCCCEALFPMEEPCMGQRPPPCSVRTKRLVDFGLQSIRGCVAKHHCGGTIGWCLWVIVSFCP